MYVIDQAMLVLTRFENCIEEEDEGEDTLETLKNGIAGFRDAWDGAQENGLHCNVDEMYE